MHNPDEADHSELQKQMAIQDIEKEVAERIQQERMLARSDLTSKANGVAIMRRNYQQMTTDGLPTIKRVCAVYPAEGQVSTFLEKTPHRILESDDKTVPGYGLYRQLAQPFQDCYKIAVPIEKLRRLSAPGCSLFDVAWRASPNVKYYENSVCLIESGGSLLLVPLTAIEQYTEVVRAWLGLSKNGELFAVKDVEGAMVSLHTYR